MLISFIGKKNTDIARLLIFFQKKSTVVSLLVYTACKIIVL